MAKMTRRKMAKNNRVKTTPSSTALSSPSSSRSCASASSCSFGAKMPATMAVLVWCAIVLHCLIASSSSMMMMMTNAQEVATSYEQSARSPPSSPSSPSSLSATKSVQSSISNSNADRHQADDSSARSSTAMRELMKRATPSRQYSFGLGKRLNENDENDETIDDQTRLESIEAERKWLRDLLLLQNLRPYDLVVTRLPTSKLPALLVGSEKRSPIATAAAAVNSNRAQRFSFGLGKRSLAAADNSNNYEANYDEDEGDYRVEKRKFQRYQFGIGKRGWLGASGDMPESSGGAGGMNRRVTNFEEFMKRRYSFGLGKRSSPSSSSALV